MTAQAFVRGFLYALAFAALLAVIRAMEEGLADG